MHAFLRGLIPATTITQPNSHPTTATGSFCTVLLNISWATSTRTLLRSYPLPPSMLPPHGTAAMTHESAVSASQERLYTRILPELLPPNLRAAPAGTRSAGTAGVVGAASAARLTEFVRGLLRSRGERAATSVMESKMQRKVLHLENMVAQSGAQSATARAARTAGRVQQGLSGKECKKKVCRAQRCHFRTKYYRLLRGSTSRNVKRDGKCA